MAILVSLRKVVIVAALLLTPCVSAFAALTREQKIFDMTMLVNTYAVTYAPYQWKVDAFRFDAFDLQPWLRRAEQTRDDIEFMELLVEYVASLNDAHDIITFPSSFQARLGLQLDIYDGFVHIDGIDRSLLPASRFPFQIGDRILSVDGRSSEEWIRLLSKYSVAANTRSTSRGAANLIGNRVQAIMPSAANLGSTAEVEILRAGIGIETFTLPWVKTGIPIVDLGTVPGPRMALSKAHKEAESFEDDSMAPWMAPIRGLMNLRRPQEADLVLNYGGPFPIFAPPAGFQMRLSGSSSDFFLSGTFEANGRRMGLIRIPSYGPPSATAAIQAFEREMGFFQENTDGLIIDQMRNPGGSAAFCEALLQRVMPTQFRTLGFEIRATQLMVNSFAQSLTLARQFNAPQWVQQLLEFNYQQVEQANREGGRTGPISINSTGSLILLPAQTVYRKPLIVLADEYSASGGDFFPAVIQDARRGKVVGQRTMGAGGAVLAYDGTVHSEGFTRVTLSLMVRNAPVVTNEYPAAPYVENIGVRPDIEVDYMTRENLMNGGATFRNRVIEIMTAEIAAGQ